MRFRSSLSLLLTVTCAWICTDISPRLGPANNHDKKQNKFDKIHPGSTGDADAVSAAGAAESREQSRKPSSFLVASRVHVLPAEEKVTVFSNSNRVEMGFV